MDYSIKATSDTPALVIYVIDTSGSMGDPFADGNRMEQVSSNLDSVWKQMVSRSTVGVDIHPRYHVAVVSYSDRAHTVLPTELMTIKELVQLGVPVFEPDGETNTAEAFRMTLDLLRREIPKRMNHPAPLVCHLTDGEFSGEDPEPYAREIMKLRNNDGAVLVENIFLGDGLTPPDTTVENWPGLRSEEETTSRYARHLLRMSSVMPESIREAVGMEMPHVLREGVRMLFPSSVPELVELAFAVTGKTGVGKRR